jgi:UDP-glucose 4-epimerase
MILITGGTGFIGLHVARSLLDRGHDVVLTRFRANRSPSFLADDLGTRAFVEPLNLTSVESVDRIGSRYPITAIVHLAVPARDALAPAQELCTNTLGLTHILDAASRWGVRRVAIASSVAVYAGSDEERLHEDAHLPMHSTSATGAFKKALEILASYYADRTGLDVVNLRIATVWGPLYHSMWNFPSRAVHSAVRGLKLIDPHTRPFFEADGTDYCYVKDCAAAIALIVTAPQLRHQTYNVGSGVPTTNGDVAAAVKWVVPHAHISLRPGHSPEGAIVRFQDITRMQRDTGFEPAYSLSAGVSDYVAWLRAGNPN